MTPPAGTGPAGIPPAATGPAGTGPLPLTPAPGAATLPRMIAAQARLEGKTLLRNGEQLLLVLIIPVLLLTAFSLGSFVSIGNNTRQARIDFLVPGVIALAVMSTAFTSQAIATGFERRYGVLKRLGATPLSRVGLIVAKTVTVIAVELLQAVIIVAVGFALGWRPHATVAGVACAVLLAVVGTAAFSGLALLMAGTLRAEATLAAANLVYLVLLGVGGVLFPLTKFPAAARGPLKLLPSGALADGLHSVLQHAHGIAGADLAVLAIWAAVGIALAARTFRWE
jgi:ABC-2 type transport system permease protein